MEVKPRSLLPGFCAVQGGCVWLPCGACIGPLPGRGTFMLPKRASSACWISVRSLFLLNCCGHEKRPLEGPLIRRLRSLLPHDHRQREALRHAQLLLVHAFVVGLARERKWPWPARVGGTVLGNWRTGA